MTRTKVVYSDLDGTMVGPGGCFFRAGDRTLTLAPTQALIELHRAGIALVLVSGRTQAQLVEACRIFGADGFVGELGAVVGWDAGREHAVLRGEMPEDYDGLPFDVVHRIGVVEELLARHAGRLEYHSPWHTDHEADVMLRGLVDVDEVEDWLAAHGWGWLQLVDNGVLPPPERPTSLHAEALPAHVYHLLPRGLSKGAGVAADLQRRGLTAADAVAIGDSASDVGMAAHVDRLWVTANGAGHDHMRELIAQQPNVRVCAEEVGLGWAEAIRDAVGGEGSAGGGAG